MAVDPNDIIFTTRHYGLSSKDEIWKLIYNSYVGGTDYYDAGYLVKYPKESNNSFSKRKERACYFNQVSPIVDMLSGLLFLNDPNRQTPKNLDFFKTRTSKGKGLNEFMKVVAAYSVMFTCGVLIDSPAFDSNEIKTEADRIANNINPYAILYMPFEIRDFYPGYNGELEWVILDNSYVEHSDPFSPAKAVTEYRLWTRTYYQDFRKITSTNQKNSSKNIETDGPKKHNLGIVPFKFISWRDDNNDFIEETIFEDIARVSKLIYNSMSYMDEMLASGTFKMLAYPSRDGKAPPEMTSGGVGALSIIPYPIDSPTQPEFIGATLQDIDPFIKAMGFYMAEILKKVGLSTDETKEFVKSGVAKKIDFQKMRALLVSGSMALQKLEMWMFETVAKWQHTKEKPESIEYNHAFSSEDLMFEVQMLMELLVYPVDSLKQAALTLIVKKLLSNDLENDKLQEIYADIKKNIKTITEDATVDSNTKKIRSAIASKENVNSQQIANA